jgi:hypothetical protein
MTYMVHITHCCPLGCKYGDDDCPVVLGKAPAKYQCESCTCELSNQSASKIPDSAEKENAWWDSLTLDEKKRVYILLK